MNPIARAAPALHHDLVVALVARAVVAHLVEEHVGLHGEGADLLARLVTLCHTLVRVDVLKRQARRGRSATGRRAG